LYGGGGIKKAQRLKTKTFAYSNIKDNSSEIKLRGRLLASFQDDAKYEHVGQDTRSQGGKDDQDKQGKDLKISDIKTKSKDNDKGSRSKITKHEGTSLQRIQRPRPQDLNDKSNLIDLMKECHNELTSGEIHEVLNLDSTWTRSCYRRETFKYSINTACDQVEFKRISLTGFRRCTSRSRYWSISKQTTRKSESDSNYLCD
ncbi:hypothetical protein Tco_1188388, partial [Tanacetum coccineum]